ncbi:c-type cytochrome [Hyphobacterium sp.]|uniref:c-type cytochrome n=1 Tax=Hyphobacterium sp. TaxID=2004662 RepID=UPI003BA8776F
MGDLFWNKVAAVAISMVLLVMVIGVVGDIVFSEDDHGESADLAYPIDLAEVLGGSTSSAPVEEEALDLGTLLAAADASAGERLFRRCVSCHNAAPDAGNLQGPNMWEVVGRDIGAYPGFSYSSVMAEFPGEWTYENLDAFIASPRGYMNGTAMAFAGIRDEADRADLLAYLGTLSSNPVAFPAPAVADVVEAAGDMIEDAAAVIEAAPDTLEAEAVEAADQAADMVDEQLDALEDAVTEGDSGDEPQDEDGN